MRGTSITLGVVLGLGAALGGSCTPGNVFECGADDECVIAGIIAVWILAEPAPFAMAIAEKPYYAESNPYWNSWELRLEDALYFAIANDMEQSVTLTKPPAGNGDSWVHLAGVYDGLTVTLYVDGQQVDQAPASKPGFDTQDVIIGAGASGGMIDEYFVGGLDEVRLHGRALSAQEIEALVAEGSA